MSSGHRAVASGQASRDGVEVTYSACQTSFCCGSKAAFPTRTARIVVLGAGLAGLETAFLLHTRLHGRADLQVVCERE
jgi:hypothetical protein